MGSRLICRKRQRERRGERERSKALQFLVNREEELNAWIEAKETKQN